MLAAAFPSGPGQCGEVLGGGWLCVLDRGHLEPCARVLDIGRAGLERLTDGQALANVRLDLVQCALCERTLPARSSAAVYGEADPFDTPRPVIDAKGTGWLSWADRYFCPNHRDAPQVYNERTCADWNQRAAAAAAERARVAAAAAAEWDRANPRPELPGKPWGVE